jgi:hypothetical protein
LVRRERLIGYFPIHLFPPLCTCPVPYPILPPPCLLNCLTLGSCSLVVRKWGMVPISSFLHYPPLCLIEPLLSHAAHTWSLPAAHRQLSVTGRAAAAVQFPNTSSRWSWLRSTQRARWCRSKYTTSSPSGWPRRSDKVRNSSVLMKRSVIRLVSPSSPQPRTNAAVCFGCLLGC